MNGEVFGLPDSAAAASVLSITFAGREASIPVRLSTGPADASELAAIAASVRSALPELFVHQGASAALAPVGADADD